MTASPLLRDGSDALIAACGALTGLLCSVAVWTLFSPRPTPAERERRRRLAVNSKGRVTDATITEARESLLYYSYSIAGVNYTASQDMSALASLLPDDPAVLIGPASLKYLPENPANSIVICEVWSGLRTSHRLAV